MKALVMALLICLCSWVQADEVKIDVNPPRPVAGEVFQVIFRISTESTEEPAINFSSAGLEVIGKSNQGVSTRSIYANGSLTVSREMIIVYELVSAKPGTLYLRDINVQFGDKNLKHSSVVLYVLKEPEAAADVFVMAEVPKTELFVGEGVTVRYFLYSKGPVNGLDIKRYPKLNNFLKRFLQEPDRVERVNVRGEIYHRSQIYAAKLFPEKVGELKVDTLSLSATYAASRMNDPFGAFGLNREFKTRTFNSDAVTITVKPLPAPVPAHFTGLVGKHEFALNVNQQKLIVNEPLEVKLTVDGPGALENLEAPTLIKHKSLEEFESTGDLKINDADAATKTFEYTFLAKDNLTLPALKVTLSYFDPSSLRYVPVELSLPQITVAGGNTSVASPDLAVKEKSRKETNSPLKLPEVAKTFSGPLLKIDFDWSSLLPYLNITLASIALLFALSWLVSFKSLTTIIHQPTVPKAFKRGQISFGELARWMSPLIHKTGKSPWLIIKESTIDESSKDYFLGLLSTMDQKDYASRKSETQLKYDAKHFRQLARYIEKAKNEDLSQSA